MERGNSFGLILDDISIVSTLLMLYGLLYSIISNLSNAFPSNNAVYTFPSNNAVYTV